MALTRRHFVGSLLATSMLAATAPAQVRRGSATRPNIITIVLDDVGYSDLGCFGSEIRTPNIDRLANAGLRYARFDTKAVCSATRAALMTGRNSHTVNMSDVPDLAAFLTKAEADSRFYIPDSAWNMPQVLKRAGYSTWAIGKWHLIPGRELPENAVHKSWPRQRGFDYFYGYAKGWTDQYKPDLVENDTYLKREFPDNYHLSVDLTDKAILLIERHVDSGTAGPFYLNLAYGTAHSPIQVPREYSRKYDAVYAKGWDVVRSERFQRMKRMGIIPENTDLSDRTSSDRAWADLAPAEKQVFARYMAVYAGFIEHCDEQLGRFLDMLDARGLSHNTLIMLFSDNGPASEAGQAGEFDGLYNANTIPIEEQVRRIDELGTPKLQSEYPRPWALVGSTPLQRYKLWPYSGGTRTPMIVRWPATIAHGGAIRHQYVDVIDVAPTLLAAAGTSFPKAVDGVPQLPVAGRSFLTSFTLPRAPGREVQYFELRGNRAITAGRWRAVAMHDCGTPFEQDKWELYDLQNDFSESVNLAARYPAKVDQMKSLWADEWQRFGSGPMREPPKFACASGGALLR